MLMTLIDAAYLFNGVFNAIHFDRTLRLHD